MSENQHHQQLYSKKRKSWLRRHWGACLSAFMALVVVLMLVLPSFVNWNSYRSVIESLMSKQMGSAVTLKGEISATLLPAPRITAAEVDMPVVGTVKTIDMLLDPLALLVGDVKPVDMTISGARLTLKQETAGELRFKDWQRLFGDEGLISPRLGRMSVSDSLLTLEMADGATRQIAISQLTYGEGKSSSTKTIEALIISRDVPVQLTAKFQPVGTGDDITARIEGKLPGGTALFSGRIDGAFRPMLGRVSFKGSRLDTAISSLMESLDVGFALTGAAQPFVFDFRLQREGQETKIRSFAFSLAGSTGAATFTHSPAEGISGDMRLGVLKGADWDNVTLLSTRGFNKKMPKISVGVVLQGLETRGQRLRNLSADLTLEQGLLRVDALQALLPGVSQLSLTGQQRVDEGDFNGQLSLTSASPRDLLRWLGVKRLDSVPEERLTTLQMESQDFSYTSQRLLLDKIKATIDATSLGGTVSLGLGTQDGESPSSIVLTLDQLNLDPYRSLITGNDTESDSGNNFGETGVMTGWLKAMPAQMDITTGTLIWGGQQFLSSHLKTNRSAEQLVIEDLKLLGEKGRDLTMRGTYGLNSDGTAVRDLTLTGSQINGPIARAFFPAGGYLSGLPMATLQQGASLNFSLVQKGTVADHTLDLSLKYASGALSLSGSGKGEAGSAVYALDGEWQQRDSRALMAALGYEGYSAVQPLPLDAVLKIRTDAPLPLTLTGKTGPVDFTLGIKQAGSGADTSQARVTVDIKSPQAKLVLGQQWLTVLSRSGEKPLHIQADISHRDSAATVKIGQVKVGDVTLTGSVGVVKKSSESFDASYQISGAVSMDGYSEDALFMADKIRSGWSVLPYPASPLPVMTGDVAVTATNSSILGQKYAAGTAELSLRSGGLSLTKLNLPLQSPVKAAAGVRASEQGDIPALTGSFSYDWGVIDGVDLPARAFSVDLKVPALTIVQSDRFSLPVSAQKAQARLTLSGRGSSESDLVKSLQGSASLSLQQGVLHGIDIGAISWAARETGSYSGFLKGLRNWQASGENPVDSADFSVVIDGGAALLNGVEIRGPWGQMQVEGQLGLQARQLTMRGQISLQAMPDEQPLALLLNGDVTAPRKTLDTAALEQTIKARIEDKETTELGQQVAGQNYKSPVMMVYHLMLPSLRIKQAAYLEELTQQMRAEAGSEAGAEAK